MKDANSRGRLGEGHDWIVCCVEEDGLFVDDWKVGRCVSLESLGTRHLTFTYAAHSNIQGLEHWIDRGVPVMVQQVHSEDDLSGHMRVVIGYDDVQRIIITHDSADGPFYRLSYDEFALLWRDLVKYVYPDNPLNESYIIVPTNVLPTTTIISTSSSLTTSSVSLVSMSTGTTSTSTQTGQTTVLQLSTNALASVGTGLSSIEYLLGALALIAIVVVVAVLKSRSGRPRQR